jgi:hypothetical protein
MLQHRSSSAHRLLAPMMLFVVAAVVRAGGAPEPDAALEPGPGTEVVEEDMRRVPGPSVWT